jgi:hypothetical protein
MVSLVFLDVYRLTIDLDWDGNTFIIVKFIICITKTSMAGKLITIYENITFKAFHQNILYLLIDEFVFFVCLYKYKVK